MREIANVKENSTGRGLIIAPTYDLLRRETRAKYLAACAGTDFDGVLHQMENTLTMPNGYKVYFRSADNPYSLEAGQFDWAWWDEAGACKVMAWIVLQARLAMQLARCLFTTTPYAANWLKSEIQDRWKKGEVEYDVIRFPSTTNPAYPVEEFERMRRTLPPAIFERRYMGVFTKLAGLVYPDMDSALIDPFDIPEHWKRIGGVDFGFHSPFVILSAALSPDDVIYVWKEYYTHPHLEGDRLTEQHVEHVERATVYQCDPEDPQARVDMQAMIDKRRREAGGKRYKGVQLVQAKNPIMSGIIHVTRRLKSGRLKIFKGACPNMMDEAELYRYPGDEMEPEKGEKPVDADNHAMDTLRYMIYDLDAESGMAKPDIWEL